MCSGMTKNATIHNTHTDWNDLDSSPPKCVAFSPWINKRWGLIIKLLLCGLNLIRECRYSKSCRKRIFFRECVFVGCVFIISNNTWSYTIIPGTHKLFLFKPFLNGNVEKYIALPLVFKQLTLLNSDNYLVCWTKSRRLVRKLSEASQDASPRLHIILYEKLDVVSEFFVDSESQTFYDDVCCCMLFRGDGSYMNTSGSNLSLFDTKISPRGLNVWVVLICAWGFWFVFLLPSLMYTGKKIKLRYTVKQSKSKTEISPKMDKEKTRRNSMAGQL